MTANKFLSIVFCGAICYQLFYTPFIKAETDIDYIKTNKCSNNTSCSKIIEHTQNIEHLNRPKKYRLSKTGKDYIKLHETCVLHAYNDPDPHRRSVGWGHQIQPGEKLEHITQKKADELFDKDIEWVNAAINRLISQNDRRFIYTQGFIDGLGDMIYNCGERGVTLTVFWERWQRCRYDKNEPGYINKNDLNFTIAGIKTSRISAPGHIERRYNTHKMMLD